jgi:hypothetical protein
MAAAMVHPAAAIGSSHLPVMVLPFSTSKTRLPNGRYYKPILVKLRHIFQDPNTFSR